MSPKLEGLIYATNRKSRLKGVLGIIRLTPTPKHPWLKGIAIGRSPPFTRRKTWPLRWRAWTNWA